MGGDDASFELLRRAMVDDQLVRRGIKDGRVLDAMGTVPRHRFVDPALAEHAYEDRPLAIGYGQTISQPYMVARATELAAPQPTDRALEVGAGSGYQAAVLGRLAAEVYAIEIVPALAQRARQHAGRARRPQRHHRCVRRRRRLAGARALRRHHRLRRRAPHPAAAGRGAGRWRPAGDPGRGHRGARIGNRPPRRRPLRHFA